MSMLERGAFRWVNTDDLPWRPSAFAAGVFVKDIATFVFVLEGELVQAEEG
jgi:hypothetical protein